MVILRSIAPAGRSDNEFFVNSNRREKIMKIMMMVAAMSTALLMPACASAATLTTLYTFSGGADGANPGAALVPGDRKSTRLNSSHLPTSRMPSSA